MKNLNLYWLIYFRVCLNLVNQEKHCNLYYDLVAPCLNKDQGGTCTLKNWDCMQGWYGRLYGTYRPHISLPILSRQSTGTAQIHRHRKTVFVSYTSWSWWTNDCDGDLQDSSSFTLKIIPHGFTYVITPAVRLWNRGTFSCFYIPDCSVIILRNVTRQVNYSSHKGQMIRNKGIGVVPTFCHQKQIWSCFLL